MSSPTRPACYRGQSLALGCQGIDAKSNEYLLQLSCPKYLIQFIPPLVVSDPLFTLLFGSHGFNIDSHLELFPNAGQMENTYSISAHQWSPLRNSAGRDQLNSGLTLDTHRFEVSVSTVFLVFF